MDPHYFPFGKYKGHGVSQTALSVGTATGKGSWGYPYLVWFRSNATGVGQGLRNELERHGDILNSFQSVAPCQACGNPDPKLLSLAYDYGGFFANGPFVYCKGDCEQAVMANRTRLVPLGFKALLSVPPCDKGLQKVSHETLQYLAGWPSGQRVTKESAADFIDQLDQRNRALRGQQGVERKAAGEGGDPHPLHPL